MLILVLLATLALAVVAVGVVYGVCLVVGWVFFATVDLLGVLLYWRCKGRVMEEDGGISLHFPPPPYQPPPPPLYLSFNADLNDE